MKNETERLIRLVNENLDYEKSVRIKSVWSLKIQWNRNIEKYCCTVRS